MTSEAALADLEDAFASALAGAIARDLASEPPTGPLVRLVIRWFTKEDPAYVTVHALGAEETESANGDEAWWPLEWDNSSREFERTDRVAQDDAVVTTAAPLAEVYGTQVDAELEAEEAGETISEGPGNGVSRAIVETIRRLPAALAAEAVSVAPLCAVSATHFEAFGGAYILQHTAPADVVADLHARGLWPRD